MKAEGLGHLPVRTGTAAGLRLPSTWEDYHLIEGSAGSAHPPQLIDPGREDISHKPGAYTFCSPILKRD